MSRQRELKSDQPGYFEIFEGAGDSGWYFVWNCPCGCGKVNSIPLVKVGVDHGTHTWEWDGNFAQATITPSVRELGGCKSHFNLTKGVYQIHADGAPAAPNIYQGT